MGIFLFLWLRPKSYINESNNQRYTISVMLNQSAKPKNIAKFIGKNKSSIYREINRNKDKRNDIYKSQLAEKNVENGIRLSQKEKDLREL